MSNVRISHDMTASRIGAWGSHRGMAGAEREFWAQKIAKRRLDGPFGDQNDQIQDVYDETWWNIKRMFNFLGKFEISLSTT